MLDELLDIFERDKKKTSGKSAGGLRGRLSAMLDGDRDDRHSDERRYDDRDRDRSRDDDDRDGDDRSTNRKKKRELEFLDFGD